MAIEKQAFGKKSFICAAVLLAGMLFSYVRHTPRVPDVPVMEQALAQYERGDYKNAMTFLAQADSMNVPDAAFVLGAMHLSGRGIEADADKALKYYERAAKGGFAPAMTTLAVLYTDLDEKYVKNDFKKALSYAQKAADANDVEAQMMLARWYENGENVIKDVPKAVEYYKRAARNGNQGAKIALLLIYQNGGKNVKPDKKEVERWEQSIKGQVKFENIFQNRPADYIEKITP